MDNFRPHNKKHRASVDGFVPAARHVSRPNSDLHAFNHYYKPNTPQVPTPGKVRRVDGFNRIDGYTPLMQPTINDPGFSQKRAEVTAPFEQAPVTLKSQQFNSNIKRTEPVKKKRFSLRRKKK